MAEMTERGILLKCRVPAPIPAGDTPGDDAAERAAAEAERRSALAGHDALAARGIPTAEDSYAPGSPGMQGFVDVFYLIARLYEREVERHPAVLLAGTDAAILAREVRALLARLFAAVAGPHERAMSAWADAYAEAKLAGRPTREAAGDASPPPPSPAG